LIWEDVNKSIFVRTRQEKTNLLERLSWY
jgi:BMFP domain-containing protein YqiC